jgi:hypothetical protein
MSNSQPTLDLDQIMAFQPCGYDQPHDGTHYTRQRVQDLLAGRKTVTIAEIAAENAVPLKNRFWLIIKMLTDIQRHELGCRCAERVLHLCGNDPRPHLAIQAKRDWLQEKITLAALRAAAAAADDAASYAAAAADATLRTTTYDTTDTWTWQLNQALAISQQTDDEILAGLTATGLTQGDQPHVQ